MTSNVGGSVSTTSIVNSNLIDFATTSRILTSTVNGVSAATSFADTFADFICTITGNYFCDGGNTRGANLTLGTNDAFSQTFETNNTERMRIDATGNVGINNTAPAYTLDVNGMLDQSALLPDGRTTAVHSGDNVIGAGIKGVGFTSQDATTTDLTYLFAGDARATGGFENQATVGITNFGSGLNTQYLAGISGGNYFSAIQAQNTNYWANTQWDQNGIRNAVNDSSLLAETILRPGQYQVNFADLTLSNYPNTRDDSATSTPANFLYTDASGKVLSAPTTNLFGSIPVNNGLTNNGGTLQLGGTLIQDTTVDGSGLNMSFVNNKSASVLAQYLELGNTGGNSFNANAEIAIGNSNSLDGDGVIAIGDNNTVWSPYSYALGRGNSFLTGVTGDNMSFGQNNINNGNQYTYLLGHDNTSSQANNEYIVGYGNTGFKDSSKDNYIIGESNNLSGFTGSHFVSLGSYFARSGGSGDLGRLMSVGFDNTANGTVSDSGLFGVSNTIDSASYAYTLGTGLRNKNSYTVDIGTLDSTKVIIDQLGRLTLQGPLAPNGADGNANDILISNGAGAVPSWVSPASLGSSICTGSTSIFCQNGNSFGATAVLGTNDAQSLAFETNNSQKMIITGAGNVGINYANPTSKLDVSGISMSNPTITSTGAVASFRANGLAELQIMQGSYGANQTLILQGRNYLTGNSALPLLLQPSGGNVGVGGVTDPQNALQVGSSTGSISGLRLAINSSTASATGTGKFLAVDANGDVYQSNALGLSTLAVGTTTVPTGKVATFQGDIDVSGVIDPTKILFSNLAGTNSSWVPSANSNNYQIEFAEGGNLNFKSASTTNILQLNNSGNVSIGSNIDTGDKLFVTGNQIRFDLTGVGSQSFLFNNDGGRARIFSTAGIDYQSNVTTGVQHTFANDIGASFAGTDFMTIDSRAASTTVGMNILKVQSSVAPNALIVKNDGNVGIGTSNPLYKFVVSSGGAQGLEMNPASSTLFDIQSYNRSTGQYIDTRLTAANFDFRAAGAGIPTMYMSNSGRKVGMGTSTPRAILDIIGAGTSSTTNSLMVSNSSNVNMLTVRDDGRIGVGTTTPGNALHIASSTISKGISGLRLGITNASTTKSATTTSRVLSVDANGDVVMATVPGTQNVVDFFVNANPNTAGTTFTPNQPQDGDVIYVSDIDNSTWIWDGAAYVTYTAPASTEWMLSNSTTDAGSNKNSTIWRNGTLGIGTSTPNSIITAISTNTRPIITMGNTVNNTGNWSSMFAQTSTNTGTHSFVAGYQQNNTGPYSVMFGRQASNTANYSLLAGFNSQNSSQYSVLIGNGLTNNIGSDGSALFGGTNNNSGVYSVLGGSANVNTASGDYSAMFGVSGYNEGSYSLIAGRLASNTSPYSMVVGNVNTNTGSNSFVGGSSNVNAGAQSVLYGNNNQNAASGQYAYIFGGSASNTGTYSILAGSSLKNLGHYNAVFGSGNDINSGNYNLIAGVNSSSTGASNIIGGQSQENSGNYNIVAGYSNVNTGQGSAVVGYSLNNAANYTGIFGLSNAATGSYHLISGYKNDVTGTYNLVSGANHTVNADQNIVGGNQHNVVGNGNLVMGYSHNATGTYSIITGYNNDNSGNFSAIFGQSMTNNGTHSLLAGSNNINNGNYNSIFGATNVASGTDSIIAGRSNVQTGGTRSFMLSYNSTSTSDYSLTVGSNHVNSGERSVVFNDGNTNNSSYSFTTGFSNVNNSYMSAIFGRYAENDSSAALTSWTATNSLFAIGNGTSNAARNNALTILKNGDVGIGTSTPQSLLHLSGNVATPIIAERTNSQNVNMEFKNTLGSWFVGQNQTGQFAIGMSNNLGTGAPFYIATTSYVGIGTNAPTANFQASGTIRFSSFGAGTLTTDASGNVTASSDERLKDIQGDYTRGLEDLRKIKPIKYKWNELSGLERENVYSGFSAQNVGEAIPEAVSTDPRGYLSLQERPILAALVNAVKEIADKLDKFTEVVSTKLIQTDKLCIGSTCVDEAQLKQMLNNQNITQSPIPNPTPVVEETVQTPALEAPATTTEPTTVENPVTTEIAPSEVAPIDSPVTTETTNTEPVPAE